MATFNLSNVIVPRNIGYERDDDYYKPDFGTLGKLQEQFGNDIDLMVNKPQYRDLINANMQPIQSAGDFPAFDGMTDEQMADMMPSREMDVNELREYAIKVGSSYKADKSS